MMAERYLIRVLLGLDQFCNTIIGGWPDETISARTGRLENRWGWRVLGKLLNWLQTDHIKLAIEHERDGSQQSPAYAELYAAYKAAELAKAAAKIAAEAAKTADKAVDVAEKAVEKIETLP